MSVPVNDIAIQKVRVKAAATADAEAFVQDLQSSQWNLNSEQWLFVRSLAVKGKKQELRQQTHLALDAARRGAVHGGSNGAQQANAVCFPSFAELVAFLVRDLVNGDAVFRWYWERWAYLLREAKSHAIARLFWENVEVLPQVVVHLQALHRLAETWLSLEPQAAQTLVDRLKEGLASIAEPVEVSQPEPQTRVTTAVSLTLGRLPEVQRTWGGILTRLNPDDPRVELASAITGISHFPVLYAQAPQAVCRVFYQLVCRSWSAHRWFAESLAGPGAGWSMQPATDASVPRPGAYLDSEKPVHAAPETGDSAPGSERAPPDRPADSPAPPSRSTPNTRPIDTKRENRPTHHSVESKSAVTHSGQQPIVAKPGRAEVSLNEQADESANLLSGGEFYTAQGGAFYILNALRTEQNQLLTLTSASQPAAGFHWLYEALRRLGVKLDISLQRFLAAQMGFKHRQALQDLEPDPEFDAVSQHLQRRFSPVWNPDLLEVPAVVVYTNSHIDVFLPLDSVKLDVRFLGLDVNPGWLPWLGRVVAFHYRRGIPQSEQEYNDECG